MDYISYIQTEALLRKYPALKALLHNLQIELEHLWRNKQNNEISEDDILYSLAIGNKVLSDMPRSSNRSPGDKDLGIIEQKDRIINKEYIKEICQTINIIGEVIEKTTIALGSLPAEKQTILREFYCEDKTWGEISSKIGLERETLKKRRRQAIERMLTVIRINKEQFEFCIGKLKRSED